MTASAQFDLARILGLAWVVVVTKPFQEIVARRNLEAQGFPVYLPMKLYENRRKEVVSSPFFPRYLFAQIDVGGEEWRRVWSTIGCHSLLGATPTRPPAGVADWVIERVRQQEEGGYIRMMGEVMARQAAPRPFTEGQIVRMAGSPLEAVFVEQVDSKRAAILVSLLGRDSRVTVDLAKLRATLTAEQAEQKP